MATTGVGLFRALRSDEFPGEFHVDGVPAGGLLYPSFEAKTYIDDKNEEKTGAADVVIQKNPETNEREVQPKGGTSLFDVVGWFGYEGWKYFEIPKNTEYPDSLVIQCGKKPRKRFDLKAYHYQIEPRIPMTVDAFKGALDNFARSAVAKSVALAKA